MEDFFSRNSGGDLRSDAHQSQITGGDADVDHTQIIGGDTVKLLGRIYLPSPRVSAPLNTGMQFVRRLPCQCTHKKPEFHLLLICSKIFL